MERLPCGCLMGEVEISDGERAFVMEPCALDCRFYLYAVEETERQGKEVRKIDLR